MWRPAAFLVACLATGALAVPTGDRWENKCARQCFGSGDSTLGFAPGKLHVYDYQSDVATTLSGATDEASRLHVTATAEITANSGCDLTLQLRDVTLKDSAPKDAYSRQEVDRMATFRQELERWPLHFHYEDGRIFTLCANPSEPVWVLNFKRGLLSTLVNGVHSLEARESTAVETDVTGKCDTEYTVEKHASNVEVTKTKDLLSCSGRGHLISSLQSTPYTADSRVQSLPLLRSSLTCRQKISTEGRLLMTECEERHLFKPFSQGENGAVTVTSVLLTERYFQNAAPSYNDDMETVRSGIMFDHSDAELTQQNRVDEVATLLASLERDTADGVRPEVPRHFTRLVHMLRHFNEAGLTELEGRLATEEMKRYFVDALPLAGTAPAMAIMRELMRRGEVAEKTADRWMTALAFVHEPSLEMVEALAPLLEDPAARRQTLLGVSALVHHYCERNTYCDSEAPVRRVAEALERLLGTACRANSEEEELRVLTALKAIGNAGRATGSGAATLQNCFERDNSIEIRLAAVSAFRRMPCDVISKSGLMTAFADQREDTEVRIAAYMGVMQCPTRSIVDEVQKILADETVNQVSSFVWSHLSNMQETSDPTRQYMKSLLYNVDLAKKFSTDARKFSRYFEKTMFFESMNAGATVDGSLVFTPDSYLPKTGVFNFTVDMFGQSINLLEVGGRVEGLEDFSESLFGSGGIYPQEVISQMLKTLSGRGANDVSTYSRNRIESPKASAYLKIFGNELKFGKYDSVAELMSALKCDGPIDFLQKLAKDMDWTENYQFLDSAYTIPTIGGFPFTLKAIGAATVSLKTGGKFQIESWSKMNIDGHVKPSAAIEIMSEMTVDAYVAHTGLKMNTNLHTSTVFDGHAIVDGGKLVSVKINMPRDKYEVLDVTTRFHSVHRNKARALEMQQASRFEMQGCSDKYLSSELLGVNFCADVSYSRGTEGLPSCLLSGPLTARFTIEKTDTFKAFEFQYRHSNEGGVRKSNIVFDTVGSTVDRRLNADYVLNFPRKEFSVGFRSPIKSMALTSVLDLEGQTKRAEASLTMDNRELFGLIGSLEVDDNVYTVRYVPSLSVRGPGGELAAFTGGFIASKNKFKYTANLAIDKIFQRPVVLKGSLSEAQGTYSVTTALESSLLDTDMKGTFRFAGDNLFVQTTTEYSFLQGERQTINVNAKMSKDQRGETTVHKLVMDSKFSALPLLDCQLTAEREATTNSCKSKIVLIRNTRQYEVNSFYDMEKGKIAASVGFVANHWDVDFKLGTEIDFNIDNRLAIAAEARLNKEKFAKAAFALDYLSNDEGFNYGVSTELSLPMGTYQLTTGVRKENHAGHFKAILARETRHARDEIALVALLAHEKDACNGEVTFSIPHRPRLHASFQLVHPGRLDAYQAKVTLQRGEQEYTLDGELRGADLLMEREKELVVRLATPRRRYSALVTVLPSYSEPTMRMDLNVGRRIVAALSANLHGPDSTGNFEIFWDHDVDSTQKASLELLQRDNVFAGIFKYPGREIKLDVVLKHNGLDADLQYAPGQVIRLTTELQMQERNGFIMASHVNTPIYGFRTMSLTVTKNPDMRPDSRMVSFEMVGSIEEEQMRLTGQVLAALPHVMLDLDLTTPFRGWEHNRFDAKYYMDGRTFNARASAARNEDVLALGGNFEMASTPEAFKISTALDIALPTDLLRKGKVGFDLKYGESNLDSGVLVQWTCTHDHEISLTLTSQHSFQYGEASHIDSTVTLATPFFDPLSAHLQFGYDSVLSSSFDLALKDAELFHAHVKNGLGKGNFVFRCAKCPVMEAAYTDSSLFTDSPLAPHTISASVVTRWEDQEASLSFSRLKVIDEITAALTTEHNVTLVIPYPVRRYSFHQRSEVDLLENKFTESSELGWNNKKITTDIDFKMKRELNEEQLIHMTGFGKITTPFQGWESAQMSQTVEVTRDSAERTVVNSRSKIFKGEKFIEVNDNMAFLNGCNWQLSREVISNSRWVSHANAALKFDCQTPGVITLSATSEWDGETAEFVFSHRAQEMETSSVTESIKAKWYGGVARSLKLAMENAANTFRPSLDITYDAGKTLRIFGAIVYNKKGESTLTLEAPFTSPISLTASHDWKPHTKKMELNYLHNYKQYTIDLKFKHDFPSEMKMDIKISTPWSCMGEAAFDLEYKFDEDLELDGKLIRNDQVVSLKSKFGIANGQLEVATPFEGLAVLSASYICAGDSGEIRLKREDKEILIVMNRSFASDVLMYNVRVNTPYYGYETMTAAVTKPMREDRFAIEYTRGRHSFVNINTRYHISDLTSSFTVKATSSLEGFSTAELHLGYDVFEQTAVVSFEKEGLKMKMDVAAELTIPYSNIVIKYENSLISGPETLTVSGKYNLGALKKSLDLLFEKDGERFMAMASAQLEGDASFLTFNVVTPLQGYEHTSFVATYNQESNGLITIKIGASKNDMATEAKLEAYSTPNILRGTFTIVSPFEKLRNFILLAEVEQRSDQMHAKLSTELNARKYEIIGKAEFTRSSLRLSLTTPFRGLELLGFEGRQEATEEGKLHSVIITRNEDQIHVSLTTDFSWTKSLVALEATSPFVEAKSLRAILRFDLVDEQKTLNIHLARNDEFYQINVFGVMKYGAATALVELKTTIPGWEDTKYHVTYNLAGEEKSMEISYERNGVKTVIASRGSYNDESAYIDLITPIEGYERMGIKGRYISKRGKREAGYDAHINDHRHRVYVKYERVGMDSAKLRIESPIEDMHLIEVDARKQEFPDGIGYYINTNRDGKRNSVEIRTVREDGNMGVDVSVKSYVKGLENLHLSGTVMYKGRKRSFSFKSNRNGDLAEISGEVTMKRRAGNGQIKAVLPIEGLENVDLSFDYKLGNKNSFRLTSIRGGVTREFSGDLQYTDSSFTINLNTPYNGFQQLHADASRSQGPDGKISAEINLKRESRAIAVSYDYLFSKTSGSANIKISTPYNGFKNMQSSLNYNIGTNSRSISFYAKRGGRVWDLQTTRTWQDGKDDASLTLSTPIDEIRSVKISRSFNIANLAAMTYSGSYERNGARFEVVGSGGIESKGLKSSFDVTISTPLKIGNLGAKVVYDFTVRPRTIEAKLSAGDRYATLSASIGNANGQVNLVTTNPKLPSVAITYTADVRDNFRDISARLELADGRHLDIVYNADYTKAKQGSGSIKVDSTTYGERNLIWNYQVPGDDLTGQIQYTAPTGSADFSISVQGKRYVRRTIIIKSSVQFPEIYTSTRTATIKYNRKSGLNFIVNILSNGKRYKGTFDAKEKAGERIVEITYDGQLLKNLKIEGTWTIPRDLTSRKDFDIKYTRGKRKGSLKGFLLLGSSGKSGSFDITLTTPLKPIKSLHLDGSWDVILPNRIVKINYERNGLRFGYSMEGSRTEKEGSYTITYIFPSLQYAPGKTTNKMQFKTSFDLRTGYKFEIIAIAPEEGKFLFDLQFGNGKRTLTVEASIGKQKFVKFSSERNERPQGPEIHLDLETSYPGFEKVDVDIDIVRGASQSSITVDYKRGANVGKVTGVITGTDNGRQLTFNVQTPLPGFEDVSLSGSYEYERFKKYGLVINYARGQKYVRLNSHVDLNVERNRQGLQSADINANIKFDSLVTRPIALLVVLDGNIEFQPRRSGNGKLTVTFNEKTYSLTYRVNRAETGRRTARLVITTPHKGFKKITYNGDVSLAANKATFSVEYGRKQINLDVSWFAGEAYQYGAELRLKTPYPNFNAIELDAKATLNRGDTVDVLVHYRRGAKMVHVTGTLEPYMANLDFETPTYGNFNVHVGFTMKRDRLAKVIGLVKHQRGWSAGAEVGFKIGGNTNDMAVTIDIQTPNRNWQRLNVEIAYTNIEGSNVVHVAFESPLTKRIELSFELTNHSDGRKTDFRAGVSTNYMGNAFVFRTNIMRDEVGMKYELEIESPFHILPSFKLTGRR